MKSPGLNYVFKYENILKDDYFQELLQKYTEELNKMATYIVNQKIKGIDNDPKKK